MCLIIANPDGKPIPTEDIIDAYARNPHGFGMAWARNGRLYWVKSCSLETPDIIGIVQEFESYPSVIHFRYATSGLVNDANCHPFIIERQLSVSHNGIIPGLGTRRKSDTWIFVETVVRKLYHRDKKFYLNRKMLNAVEKAATRGNKFAFLDHCGNLSIVGERYGVWRDGLWYSDKRYRYPTPEWDCVMCGRSVTYRECLWIDQTPICVDCLHID